ncbi:MAG: cation transporter [Parachlamydiales bacterium]|nr:cation transporter [Verrucomicrobiota bacterium]MBX3719410.1 cation transporter [Candidatus Acheromyda pituitae]
MGHEHASPCCQGHTPQTHGKALYISIAIAFIFMLIEVVGGWIANSLALISDALHLFTDVGALSLSLIVLRIAHWPKTPSMSYGYQRAEILGALASALSLWALCGVLIYEAIMRLITPEPVQGPIVFVIATIGLFANLMMMRILHPSQGQNINIRAAYLHVLGDLLGSAGVIIGGAVLWWTKWYPIDPIITILFSLGIVYGSGKIIRESVSILMESAPSGIDPLKIEQDLLRISGVREVHDLHVWAVSHKKIALSAHLVAENTHGALSEAHRIVESNYGIQHMTFQVEDPEQFESKYCYDCAIK